MVAASVALGAYVLRREAGGDDGRADDDGGAPVTSEGWRGVEATYVGTAACGDCHRAQAAAFEGSDHDRAMETPTPSTVAAPFDGRAVPHDGSETRFQREGDRYLVRTRGADGEVRDYPVAWTFGFEPLQQYLVDVGGGRLQAFTIAWDDRPAADGGQRFYDLYPDEDVPPDDPLHWTGRMQNWNHVCADCHSTAYRKGYDADEGTFSPVWVEPDVGCEACHGPGARHIAWARADPERAGGPGVDVGLVIDLRNDREWTRTKGARNASPQPETTHVEVDTCAPCHSRRHQVGEARRPDQPLLDFYRPELLTDPALYHPDGQISGEVYVYGSFLQSRMFHAGVRCSDCHDPHTAGLRAEGDALCARCHDAAHYAAADHHHHEPGTRGSACVDCHMPAKVYMGVDARRDHSVRVPRPDLGARIGVPDPCTGCHENRDAAWAAESVEAWTGASPADSHPGIVLAAARSGDPAAFDGLVALAGDAARPAIVRGTALAALVPYGEPAAEALGEGARDPDPLVRLGAVYGTGGQSPQAALAILAPVLGDARRVLRVEAARTLSAVPADRLPPPLRTRLEAARREVLAVEGIHADRPEAWLRRGIVELGRGRRDAAEAALRRALAVAPDDVAVRVNLADLARARGDEAEAERWLREALARAPDDAGVHHALGLLAVRTGRREEALTHLARAAALRPEEHRYAYVHAVALWSEGRRREARAAVAEALAAHPHDRALQELQRTYRADAAR